MTRVKKRGSEEVMKRIRVRKREENQGCGDTKSVANPYLCLFKPCCCFFFIWIISEINLLWYESSCLWS